MRKKYRLMKQGNGIQLRITVWQKIALVIFGIFLSCAILEIGLRLGGFIFLSMQEYRNLISIKQKDTYRIICLGESTTAGQYPAFLEEILNQSNTGIKFSVVDKGIPATDTTAILFQLEDNLNQYKPDMVVVMMGINDELSRDMLHITFELHKDSFLRFFRTYKLFKLLRQHIVKKMWEIRELKNVQHRAQRMDSNNSKAGKARKNRMFLTLEKEFRDDAVYIDASHSYLVQGKYAEAEAALAKAIALNPHNVYAYLGLARVKQYLEQFPEAEQAFKKAIQLDSKNEDIYLELGWYYRGRKNYFQAEEAFKQMVRLNKTRLDIAYFELSSLYFLLGRYAEAEAGFKEAIKINPQNVAAHRGLLSLYEKMGVDTSKEYLQEMKIAKRYYYDDATRHNFQLLKSILDQKGIKMVCVQYPLRSTDLLKDVFYGEQGIIFVDNEESFKKVVRNVNYSECFTDIFAGDFGHCTENGNRLLAENIAHAILKEVFKQ